MLWLVWFCQAVLTHGDVLRQQGKETLTSIELNLL